MLLLPFGASPGCWGTSSAIGRGSTAWPSYDEVTSSPPPGGIGSRPSGSSTTVTVAATTSARTPPSAQRFGRSRRLVAGTSSATSSSANTHGPIANHPSASRTSPTTKPTGAACTIRLRYGVEAPAWTRRRIGSRRGRRRR